MVASTPELLMYLNMKGKEAIMMDFTHGTNKCGLLLITLMVPTDLNESLLVAWCLSAQETKESVERFLKRILICPKD